MAITSGPRSTSRHEHEHYSRDASLGAVMTLLGLLSMVLRNDGIPFIYFVGLLLVMLGGIMTISGMLHAIAARISMIREP